MPTCAWGAGDVVRAAEVRELLAASVLTQAGRASASATDAASRTAEEPTSGILPLEYDGEVRRSPPASAS